jgi:glycosyltransferase involved in cell wall biosynthesis
VNILLVIDSFGAGGAQNQLSLLAVGLKHKGHTVTCFQYFDNNFFKPRLDSAGIPLLLAAKRDKAGLNVVWSLVKLLRKERFDVVLSFMDTPNFYAALACRLGRQPPLLVVSHRCTTLWQQIGAVQHRLRLWSNRQANCIVCNSQHERSFWQSLLPGQRIETIYNGIVDELPAGVQVTQPLRVELDGIPDYSLPILLAVGTITARKNGLLMVSAMQQLQQQGRLNFRLVWLGEEKANLPEDVAHARELRAAVNAAGLQNHWSWAGQQANPLVYYRAADALLHAGTEEGLPNVVCEAQMAGLPAIVADVLDHPLMISHEQNGLLFDAQDAAHLADTLGQYFAFEPERIAAMREASRSAARCLYSMGRFVAEYELVFDEQCRSIPSRF